MPTCLRVMGWDDPPVYWFRPDMYAFHRWASSDYWDCHESMIEHCMRVAPPVSRSSVEVRPHLADASLLIQLAETEQLLRDLQSALPPDLLSLICGMYSSQVHKQEGYALTMSRIMAKEGFWFVPEQFYPCPDDPALLSIWQFYTDHGWWGYVRNMVVEAQHVCRHLPPLPCIVRDCLVHYHVHRGMPLTKMLFVVEIELKQLCASVSDSRCDCL